MNVKARIKEMTKEVYQPKPIAAYLIGIAADMISTYVNVKKYSPQVELNEELRKLFYEFGIENSLVSWFALTGLLPIPAFYTFSKILEKISHKLARKNIEIWKELYNAYLYGFSATSFYASINNLLLYFNLPHISAEYAQIFGAAITALPFCFYVIKIYKKLGSTK
jgi:hypothetical protein